LPTMEKVKLKFRVDPDYLRDRTQVVNSVKIKFIDYPRASSLGILGESGIKMMKSGAVFEFERKLAQQMIEDKIAVEADEYIIFKAIHGVASECICGRKMSKKHDGSEC